MTPFDLSDVRFLPGIVWSLRIATGRTQVDAYVRGLINSIRAGKLPAGVCS